MKKRLTAMALALAMVLGTVVMAAGTEKNITVTPMSLSINGQTVTPTKSNGDAAEVFAYNGATYVPLRYLSELLGLQVEWDKNEPGTAKVTGNVTLPSGGDGTYTGTASGFGGEVKAVVTVVGGRITACTLTGDKETPAIGGAALPKLQAKVLAAGSTEIDGVAGATMTSNAVKAAVAAALAQATGDAAVAVKMKPGTYEGSGAGFRGGHTIDVSVKVSETEILSIEVDHDTVADTIGIFQSAEENLIPRILEHQSVSVDAITGATSSSNGIKLAVTDAIKEALAAGGSSENAITAFQKIPAKKNVTEEIDVDVLVVGLGAAGTTAAVRAAELQHAKDPANVSVLAIDTAGRYGGMASLTMDVFSVNPPRFKTEYNEGKDYCDADELVQNWIEYCEGDARENIVRKFVAECGEVLDYLVFDRGLKLSTTPVSGLAEEDFRVVCYRYADFEKGLTIRRQGTLAFYDGMMDAFTSLGGKYMLETTGYELIYDEAANKVIGCKARNNADGTEYVIHADSVITATGGFGGNGEMEEQYLGNDYYPLKGAWEMVGMKQNKGQMIASAIDIGAGTYNIDMCPMVHMSGSAGFLTNFEYHETEQYNAQTNQNTVWTEGDIPMYMGLQANTLAVGKDGRRFSPETGIQMLNSWQSGPNYYSIYSNDKVQSLKQNGFDYPTAGVAANNLGACGPIPNKMPLEKIEEVLDAGIEAGFVFKADTLEELASQLGMESAVLKNTVETYNGYCAKGVDEEMGKDPPYLEAIGGGPYYAIKMASYCYSTSGALDVNERMEVLKTDGKTPIAGLYATGLDSMGVMMTNKKAYVSYGGVAEGYAYTSGYWAAGNAVEYAAQQ